MAGTLFIICFSILIVLNTKKDTISEIIPSVFLSVMVFLYPFYYVNRLHWGRIAIIVAFIALALISVYRLIRKRSISVKELGFIPVAGYLFVLLVIILMTKDNYVWLWDSTRLWGAAPKALFYTESLQLGPNALVYPFMQSYPPGMPLLVYFIESFNNSFSEWQIYLVYGAFVSSLMLPALKSITRKTIYTLPVMCLFILIIPCIVTSNGDDYSFFYNSLFIDSVLGALFGYGIYIATQTDYRDLYSTYRLAIVLFALALLKDTGTLFAFTLFILSTVLHFQKKHIISKREFLFSFCALLSFLLPWRSWAFLIRSRGITNHTGGLQNRISVDMIHKILSTGISLPSIKYESRWTAFTVSFSLILVFLIELFLFYMMCKRTNTYSRKRFVSITVTILFSFFIFLIGYGMTYGNYDPLPSFLRYTTTLTMAPLLCMFIIASDNVIKKCISVTQKPPFSHSLLLAVLCVIMVDSLFLWEKSTNQAHICPYDLVKEHSDFIIRSVCEDKKTDKLDPKENIDLYLIYTGNPGENCIESQRLYMNLIGSGIRERNNYLNMQPIDWDSYEDDPSAINVQETFDSWYGDILEYAYIYVYDIDNKTKELFRDETSLELQKHHLYRIDKDGDRLIEIGGWD